MKVVFLQDVQGVAKLGDIKEVADGYGRNYLLPKKLALVATPEAMKRAEAAKKAEAARQARLDAEMAELARKLDGTPVTIKAKAGAEDKLFGSVTALDITDAVLKATGIEVDRRKVELDEPIKKLGTYEVTVKLAKDAVATVKVTVEAETAEAK